MTKEEFLKPWPRSKAGNETIVTPWGRYTLVYEEGRARLVGVSKEGKFEATLGFNVPVPPEYVKFRAWDDAKDQAIVEGRSGSEESLHFARRRGNKSYAVSIYFPRVQIRAKVGHGQSTDHLRIGSADVRSRRLGL